ncbi:MAG TPA: class I SAM-dependent methyltransferase [Candidatus Thermoplasmatota archaeon]|nr:class I SAM-dependent methyltransferase [Candidatus Thermoplasmatota archaeon]
MEDIPGYRLAIQGQYDALYAGLTPDAARARHAALAPYLARVIDALELPDEGYHLDLGCGDGLVALAVARLRPQMTVVGFDASERALGLARDLARAEGLRNAAFAPGDAEAPPDGQFERMSALSVFSLLADKRAALAAWRRCTLPGTKLVLTDGFAASGGTYGAGATTLDGFAQLARETRWRILHREDLTPLVTKLNAARAWTWPEYVRPGTKYGLVVMAPG